MDASGLALGTAQFGLPYGVANATGPVPPDQIATILDLARGHRIDTIDTAIAYGDSEARLGRAGLQAWQVVSKLPPRQAADPPVARWVEASVRGSLERLGIPHLHGLLLHRPHDLLAPDGDALYRALLDVRAKGWTRKIGISIYSPSELAELPAGMPVDIVQAPLNVIDRRLVSSGWLARLADAGVEVHTRSAFLQGLLLMPAPNRPRYFDRWQPLWSRWDGWLSAERIDPLQACLSVPAGQSSVRRVVVGVDGIAHLTQILSASARPAIEVPADLSSEDPDLVEPSRWPSA